MTGKERTLEMGSHRVLFDEETVTISGMEIKQPMKNEVFIKSPDQDPVAAIFIHALDKNLDTRADFEQELGWLHQPPSVQRLPSAVEISGPDPIEINGKSWEVVELILDNNIRATMWIYQLDEIHFCKVIMDYRQENDPLEDKIKKLVNSIKVT